jgi:hypothetical protein
MGEYRKLSPDLVDQANRDREIIKRHYDNFNWAAVSREMDFHKTSQLVYWNVRGRGATRTPTPTFARFARRVIEKYNLS